MLRFIDEAAQLLGQLDNEEIEKERESEQRRVAKIREQIKAAEGEKKMPPQFKDGHRRKRGKKIEYIFRHEGKYYSVSGETDSICYQKRADIMSGKIKRNTVSARGERLSEWLNKWENLYAEECSENWREERRKYIDRIKDKLGNLQLKNITGEDIQKFLKGFESTKNTQNKMHGILKSAFKIAFELGKIKANPLAAVRIKKAKAEKRRPLTFAEQSTLYSALSNKYRPLFMFCCCTGLRISEILELKPTDLRDGQIWAARKKKRSKKPVIMPVAYLPELMRDITPGQSLIFEGYTYNGFKSHLQGIFEKLKITGISIHSFRHTFASVCYYAGIPEKQIQAWLGHEAIDMTLNTYTHLLGSGTSNILKYIKRLKIQYKSNKT